LPSTQPPDLTPSHVRLTRGVQSTEDRARQLELIGAGRLPAHIAIIMDGNGRWARDRGRTRVEGHREGIRSVRDVTEACAQLGIRYLTLYTFSTENWQRPQREVVALMELLVRTIRREAGRLHANGIRVRTLGDFERLPPRARDEMQEAMTLTERNERMDLVLALSYSGRWELARAARRLARDVRDGRLDPEGIDEDALAARLDTAGLPDPDLLIRTGGEIRVSNFLLWQIAYAELYMTDVRWPDFRREALYDAIRDFQGRDRRFGRVEPDRGHERPRAGR
jgi:undecaprenyl diphosphate synthase